MRMEGNASTLPHSGVTADSLRRHPDFYTQRAPSTSMQTPLTKTASSDARYRQAFATSSGVEKRPIGMVAMKRCFASSVTAPPANSADSAVSGLKTGLTQFTRMRSGPNSAAMDFDITITAPFELL